MGDAANYDIYQAPNCCEQFFDKYAKWRQPFVSA